MLEFTLWFLVAACVISCLPLYLIILRPLLRTRSRMPLQDRVNELKQFAEIEKGLIVYSSDDTARIDCENKLFLLNNELFRFEKKLSQKKK